MAEGQFNIVEFANRIGLKNIRDMPVAESLMPVIVTGDLSGLVPAFRAPGAIVGASSVAGGVGNFRVYELQSLGLGGCLVDYWNLNGGFRFVISIGPPVLSGAALPNQVSSNVAPLSVMRQGVTAVAPGIDLPTITSNDLQSLDMPWYIPRGSVLRFTCNAANTANIFHLAFRDVPASEHGAA